MVMGADIIKIMKSKDYRGKYVLVEDIMKEFLKNDKKRTIELFLYTITFLFIVDIITRKDYKIRLIKNVSNNE